VYNINVVFPETTNIEVYKFNIRKLTWEFASMISHRAVELFLLKCAVIETGLRASLAEYNESPPESLEVFVGDKLEPYIRQFDISNRKNAAKMSKY